MKIEHHEVRNPGQMRTEILTDKTQFCTIYAALVFTFFYFVFALSFDLLYSSFIDIGKMI